MLRSGQIITLCALALLTLGVVMVNSALMTVAPVDGNGNQLPGVTAESILTSRSTLYMALALAALALGALLPIRQLSRLAASLGTRDNTPNTPTDNTPRKEHARAVLLPLALGVLGLLAILSTVYLPGIGHSANGSARWVRLGSLSIQPSELVKWGMIALIAWYGTVRAAQMPRFWTGLLPALLALGVVCIVIVKEDLGTGVLIAAACGLMLLAAGARFWHLAAFVPIGLAGVVTAIVISPYRVQRILAFIDPFQDSQGTGYHVIQSMAAIAGGGGTGRGLGHGFQKFGYLPEDHTDFLFAVVCEELGVAGAALVITLYLLLILTGLSIVRRETDRLLKLLGFGIMATIGLQAVINLFVVTGMAPTKGIALPLMSSGGTGWILTAACLGLLAAMDRTQPVEVGRNPEPDAQARSRDPASHTGRATPDIEHATPHTGLFARASGSVLRRKPSGEPS
ncbi:MAG: FtsW/RodA/SpoVE family cell cycle protein [Planctomycetota bacterium]|nr:FtsW/RodA/SpoVE family cell cycle protein [Planctomycetota bacterium]